MNQRLVAPFPPGATGPGPGDYGRAIPTTGRPAETGVFREVTLSPGAGQQSTRLLDVQDYGDPLYPPTMTVCLDREQDDTPAADIKALIEWGVGGTTTFVECDWARGTQLTAPATSVKVYPYLAPVLFGVAPVEVTARLRATVGGTLRGAQARPRFSTPFFLTTEEGWQTAIPRWAVTVALLASNDAPASGYPLTVQQSYNGNEYFRAVIAGPERFDLLAPPGSILSLSAVAANQTRGMAIFDLAF